MKKIKLFIVILLLSLCPLISFGGMQAMPISPAIMAAPLIFPQVDNSQNQGTYKNSPQENSQNIQVLQVKSPNESAPTCVVVIVSLIGIVWVVYMIGFIVTAPDLNHRYDE